MQKQIQYGQLTLVLPSSKTYTFGPSPRARGTSRTNLDGPTSTSTIVGGGKFDYPASAGSCSSVYRGGEGTTTTGTVSGVSTPPTSIDASSPRGKSFSHLAGSVPGSGSGSRLDVSRIEEQQEESDPIGVTIRVKDSTFFLRLLLSGDLGFAEAYMAGECDVYYTGNDIEGAGVDVETQLKMQLDEGEGESRGQRLDEGYYGQAVVDGLKGEREGEELLELFKVSLLLPGGLGDILDLGGVNVTSRTWFTMPDRHPVRPPGIDLFVRVPPRAPQRGLLVQGDHGRAELSARDHLFDDRELHHQLERRQQREEQCGQYQGALRYQ